MEFKEFVIKHAALLNNAEIARQWIQLNGLDPFKAEKYRHKVRAIKDSMTISTTATIKADPPKNVINKKVNNYLVIGDLHLPATHKDYLAFNKTLAEKFSIEQVIFIGDIIDSHAISYHESNPNLDSSGKELEKAITEVAKWYRAFPDAVVLNGNHDLLFERKLLTAGLPSVVLKDLNTILQTNNWKFMYEYITDDYYFTHGTKLSPVTIKEKCLKLQKSVICGHLHTESYIKNITQDLFVSHIGCGVDFSTDNFNYARGTSKEPVLSSLVIIKDQPILIKM